MVSAKQKSLANVRFLNIYLFFLDVLTYFLLMFYANFKPKPLSLLGFLLRFGLNSVTFNTEKAGSPQQVTRFIVL